MCVCVCVCMRQRVYAWFVSLSLSLFVSLSLSFIRASSLENGQRERMRLQRRAPSALAKGLSLPMGYGASLYAYHRTPLAASPKGSAMGSHRLSKAAGRDSAFFSRLQLDEGARGAMRAEPPRQQQPGGRNDEGDGGGGGGGESCALRFASTHAHRRGGGGGGAFREGARRRWRDPASPLSSHEDSGGSRQAVRSPLVLPYSQLAYRSRLQHARLTTVLELADTPYAPSPLQVILDVLAEVSRLQALAEQRTGAAEGEEGGAKAMGEDRGRAWSGDEAHEALARLTAALARSQDVRRLLARAVGTAADAVNGVDVVGDARSAAELHVILALVEQLTEAVLSFKTPAEPSKVEAGRWLPPATYAELLHGILELSKTVGSRLAAVSALDELITLSESIAVGKGKATDGQTEEAEFGLDDVVALVDGQLQSEFHPVSAADHLMAMESCQRLRDFDLAISLYRRFTDHVQAGSFPVSADDLSHALTALASCSNTTTHFEELQGLIIRSEAAGAVPVSVPLYTALMDAASRAPDNPNRLSIALALYRRLRDGQLTPTTDTYAALIACCASSREPTQAFAFYHEARHVCGADSFTPQLYTNLLLSYVNAGYGADARRTLDVLVDAGAPLTRAAFHAVLSGADTLREAREVLDMMTSRYSIEPTPHSYAFLIHAAAKAPRGVDTALQLFDLHEEALASLLGTANAAATREAGTEPGVANSGTVANHASSLEDTLQERFPAYVRAVEHALMRLRIDPSMDPRLGKYLRPLLRIAQQRMNAFTGGMAPQAPTCIPSGAATCVAVLAPDALANLDEWVEPFTAFYSAIVIPYSSLLALGTGGGRRVEGLSVKGTQAGLYDAVWAEAGDERSAMVEHRRRRLVRFLNDYKDVVHVVSLEEELMGSRDVRRYGVSVTDWFGRSAAFAVHLARKDVPGGTKLYAQHEKAVVVLVSANYHRCGRLVVDLKRANLRRGGDRYAGLKEGLRKVFYHNPRTQPAWRPPQLSIRKTPQDGDDATSQQRARPEGPNEREGVGQPSSARRGTLSSASHPHEEEEEEAEALYRRELSRRLDGGTEKRSPPPLGLTALRHEGEGVLDADLLMRVMAADSEG